MSDGSTIAIVERAPTPEEYRSLRASVDWNELSPDGIRAGLSGSRPRFDRARSSD